MARPPEDDGGSVPLLRPQPKRYWQITPMSTEPPTPRSPSVDVDGGGEPVKRSRSILNLTSSTLYGIYGGRQVDDNSQPPTPWGPGTMTPSLHESLRNSIYRTNLGMVDPAAYKSPPKFTLPAHLRRKQSPMQKLGNICVLAVLGLLYGIALARLHAYTYVIPVQTSTLEDYSATILAFWSLVAVVAGVGLPALDRWWWRVSSSYGSGRSRSNSTSGSSQEPGWVDNIFNVGRCMGAFVGAAFAIRKLPCDTSTQAALTILLSNPVFWYLIDGSVAGLLFATGMGTTGAAVLMGMPSAYEAATASQGTYWSTVIGKFNTTSMLRDPFSVSVAPEVLALAASTGTALFYCVVCLGNVGRALAYR